MRFKIRIFLIGLLIFIFSSTQVLASSGCCSSHGGVDCTRGAATKGNVICMDGWNGSSCSYVDKCGAVTPTYTLSPSATRTPTPVVSTPTSKPVVTITPTSTMTSVVSSVLSSPTNSPTSTPIVASSTSSQGSILPYVVVGVIGWVMWRRIKNSEKLQQDKS